MAHPDMDYSYRLGTRQAYTDACREQLRAQVPPAPWWKVLEVDPGASEEVINAAYRALAKREHPDHGGSEDRMKRLNLAHDEALKIRGAKC